MGHGEKIWFLCRLRSIAAHRDNFVWRLSVCVSVCLYCSHTFLVVTHSYVLQATHAYLGMLPLFWNLWRMYRSGFSQIEMYSADLLCCYIIYRTCNWDLQLDVSFYVIQILNLYVSYNFYINHLFIPLQVFPHFTHVLNRYWILYS